MIRFTCNKVSELKVIKSVDAEGHELITKNVRITSLTNIQHLTTGRMNYVRFLCLPLIIRIAKIPGFEGPMI